MKRDSSFFTASYRLKLLMGRGSQNNLEKKLTLGKCLQNFPPFPLWNV